MSTKQGNTFIIGLSGPSSSGKTTLARLLRVIFNISSSATTTSTNTSASSPPSLTTLRLILLHEDDFYKTDTLIPRKTFTSTEHGTRTLEDWDCVESLDLPLLQRVLSYAKDHGELPTDFASKEDKNTVGESGVSEDAVEDYRQQTMQWLHGLVNDKHGTARDESSSSSSSSSSAKRTTLIILDGFLLYPSPKSAPSSLSHELSQILAPLLSLKLFITSTRTRTIDRRTKRIGYVTLEGFWADPPGYVEDVVWPNYARDHAWMFNDSDSDPNEDKIQRKTETETEVPIPTSTARAIDQGHVNRDIAAQAGIITGPGSGEAHLREILPWAIETIKDLVVGGGGGGVKNNEAHLAIPEEK